MCKIWVVTSLSDPKQQTSSIAMPSSHQAFHNRYMPTFITNLYKPKSKNKLKKVMVGTGILSTWYTGRLFMLQ